LVNLGVYDLIASTCRYDGGVALCPGEYCWSGRHAGGCLWNLCVGHKSCCSCESNAGVPVRLVFALSLWRLLSLWSTVAQPNACLLCEALGRRGRLDRLGILILYTVFWTRRSAACEVGGLHLGEWTWCSAATS
jgi:hypothetical protein